MKAKQWREKSVGEREQTLQESLTKLRTIRFDIATRATKKHREYRALKKDIARLKTILTEESVEVTKPV